MTQAEGVSRQALAHALPTLTATGTFTQALLLGQGPAQLQNGQFAPNRSIPYPSDSLTGALVFDAPLVNFYAWSGVGAAREREKAALLSSKDTERTLLATVALAAVATITTVRVAESSRVSLASALSTLDLTKRRAALGAASAVDVLRADQDVSLSRAQVVTADEQLLQARESLGAAVGDTAQWGVSENVRIEDLRTTANSLCKPIENVDTRTDILAASKALDAAKRDRAQVDDLFFPTLDLLSTVGYQNYPPRSPNYEHIAWTIGAQAKWLLYDGGDRYGQRKLFDGAASVAEQQLVQKKRDASLQLTQADRAITVATANLEVATRARDLAKESARLSKTAFVNGSGTSFDLVDQARRLREAEIDLLIKEFRVLQARLTAYLFRSNCSI